MWKNYVFAAIVYVAANAAIYSSRYDPKEGAA